MFVLRAYQKAVLITAVIIIVIVIMKLPEALRPSEVPKPTAQSNISQNPEISLSWEPIRIVNDKIYDIRVEIKVKNANQLKWLKIKLIPVEYDYFISSYGMRQEDYSAVFPNESIRSVDLQPGREEISVNFTNLAGGREYIISAEGEDSAGRILKEEIKTPYIRQYENVAKQDNILVGAYYYPWYSPSKHWQEGHMNTPLLGLYDSRDPIVISKHIDWATGHGIDFFIISWWGPGSFEDLTIKEHFLKNPLIPNIKFAILYESVGRLKVENGEISMEGNRQILLNDLSYLMETYFNSPYYLKINNKPAVVIYLSRIFRDLSLGDLRDKVYLIGDLVYWQDPRSESRIADYDAVTSYNMHTSVQDILNNFEYNVDKKYDEWLNLCSKIGKGFIPSALPGFDDRAVRKGNIPLPRSPERFKRQLEIARSHANLMMVITTFNEWHENTQIEPSREEGMRYLQELSSYLGLQREALTEKRDLYLFKAGATHYEVRLLPENIRLIYLEPDMWQGNSDVYPLAGGRRVGHHWSQFLMLSPGKWLTDRVESEGEFLIDFKVLKSSGKLVAYSGKWGFRDYFVTTAVHYIWADDEFLYRYVKTNLTVLRDIPDPVGAIWVELMNDPDYYATAVSKTEKGLITYDMHGVTGHALKEYTLGIYGWIALINPLSSDVRGSPALILVRSSQKAHPTVCNCPNVDNIEIHMLGDEIRMLKKGDYFELHYLLIVSNKPNSYSWIDEAIKRAIPMIELIDKGELP